MKNQTNNQISNKLKNHLNNPNTNWKYVALVAVTIALVFGGILGYQNLWPKQQNDSLTEIPEETPQETPEEVPEKPEQPEQPEASTDQLPYIKVLFPNGGEKWRVGQIYDITWESEGVDNVYISILDFELGDGCNLTYEYPVPAATGKYSYKIMDGRCPIMRGNKIKIEIWSLGREIKDTSDDFFSIIEYPAEYPTGTTIPTSDSGKECTDSIQCESYCQAPKGSEIGAKVVGSCYEFMAAICMQEVRNGIADATWCY